MIKLEDWNKFSEDCYTYVGANKKYELNILNYDHKTDILSTNASVYVVSNWSGFFRRGLLIRGPLAACLQAVEEKENEDGTTRQI